MSNSKTDYIWQKIEKELSRHDYMSQVERSPQRIDETAEIFTPTALVLEILKLIDLSNLMPGKTVLDPACGDGQFLMAAKLVKQHFFGMSESDALLEIYGVDIMRDNVDICKARLGGGQIYMGNALRPNDPIAGQSSLEFQRMQELFGIESSTPEPRRRKGSSRKNQLPDSDDLWS